MTETERVDAIDNLNTLRYVLELLADFFVDSVHDNSFAIAQYLAGKLMPEKKL